MKLVGGFWISMFETKNNFSSCMLAFIRQSLGLGVNIYMILWFEYV
jgi:hypothetical protein